MSERATYQLQVGDTDVEDDALEWQRIGFARGLDQVRATAPPRAGDLGAALRGDAGTYNPDVSALQRGQLVSLEATYNGTVYPLFSGHLNRPRLMGPSFGEFLTISAFGFLARLADKRSLTTALYADLRTDEALTVLCDVCGVPKNAQPYVTDLSPAGQWGLGETSGDAVDLSGNDNDGTVAYAVGQRGQSSLDDAGDGAMAFEEGTTNLVTNPSVEVNTTGYGTFGAETLASSADFAKFGTKSLKVTKNGGAGSSIFNWTVTGLFSAGVTYAVSAYIYIPAASTWPNDWTLRWESTDLTGATQTYPTTVASSVRDTWTRIVTLITPAADVTGTIRLRTAAGSTPPSGAILYVDGFQIEAKPAATSYCDGSLGTGYSWASTAHASASTRVASKVTVADAVAIQNAFDGGGALGLLANITSDGEGDDGTLASKGWTLKTVDESGGLCRLELTVPFSTTAGIWRTDRDVPIATNIEVELSYDADSVANNPTIRVTNLSTGIRTTENVTETQTPVGTRTTDAGTDLVWGNVPGGTETLAGTLDEPFLASTSPTEAQFKQWVRRVRYAPRHFDEGKTTLAWWWLDREDAFSALVAIIASEGPGALLYEDGTGAVTFKNRHARILESRFTTAQANYGAGALPMLADPSYDDGISEVVNVCTVTVRRREAQSLDVVWALEGDPVTLGAGESRTFEARSANSDPFEDAVTPSEVAGDFTVTFGAVTGVSLDRTSGARVAITLTAGPVGATVTGLRLRAELVPVVSETDITNIVDTTPSQEDHGVRPYPLGIRREIDPNVAQDFCDAVVSWYQSGRPRLVFQTLNQTQAALESVLTRDIGDRVHAEVTRRGVDEDFLILQRNDDISGNLHVTTFGCEAAGAVTYFVLDDSELDSEDVLAW